MKAVVVTAMHGRNKTVKYCLENSPNVERVIVYSSHADREFLKDVKAHKFKYPNNPLSRKWNHAVQQLRNIDFDIAIIMGSDDYFDQKFLDFVKAKMKSNDAIGFLDAYYEQDGNKYYWEGYKNHREGEPMGAGRCYSKKFLEKIDYNLYPQKADSSLDAMAWRVINSYSAKIKSFSLKEHGLMMCDVKDGTGITPLHKIPNLQKIKGMKTYVGMATFKGRPVQKAIDSLKDQCDGIFLYDNEKNPDLTDNGKFWGLSQIKEPCYYFTCDDDLYYPENYIATGKILINIYKCIITHHGRILQGLDLPYYHGHKAVACLHESKYTGEIHVPGTGVTGFRTDYFHPKRLHLAKDKKMSDLVFGLEAAKQGKKIMTIPHKAGWIKQLPIDHETSICRTMNKTQQRNIEIANEIFNIINKK